MARTRFELHTMLCDLKQEISVMAPCVPRAELLEFFDHQARAIENDTCNAEDLAHVRKRLQAILVEHGLVAGKTASGTLTEQPASPPWPHPLSA
jgi:hypothetical protein